MDTDSVLLCALSAVANPLTSMFLDGGEEPENLNESHFSKTQTLPQALFISFLIIHYTFELGAVRSFESSSN